MLMLVVVCAGQDPTLLFTDGNIPNGLYWRSNSYGEKLNFLNGVRYGANLVGHWSIAGTPPSCPTAVNTDEWFTGSQKELIREVDAFFRNPVNLPLPMVDGVVYAIMKANGAIKIQLDSYRNEELGLYMRDK
jgi:hypothetical protein